MQNKIKLHKSIFLFCLLFITLASIGVINQFPLNQEDKIENNNTKNDKEVKSLKTSSIIEWVSYPSLNTKYFSPDTTPGFGDSAVYSFAINQTENYKLNISAYYEIIDDYEGSKIPGSDRYFAGAYLMKNGTWLIAAIDYRSSSSETYMMLGIGSNATNIVWKEVMKINCDLYNFAIENFIDIAGNESGSIRIVYTQSGAEGYFNGTKYFSTDDWGNTWSSGTLMNYNDYDNLIYNGLSIAEFQGNFTCIWGVSLTSSYEDYTIIESHEQPGSEWSEAKNLTSLEGEDYLPSKPTITYNHTNDNGSIFIGFNNYTVSSADPIIIRLNNGIESNSIDDRWLIASESPYWGAKLHFAKDYESEYFYFHIEGSGGVKNATWGQNLLTRSLDVFQVEGFYDFRIFAKSRPRFFTVSAQSPSGKKEMGILDCETPFNVRKYNGIAEGNKIQNFHFDGKDKAGKSRKAKAYSFNLMVSEPQMNDVDLILYVDDIKGTIDYDVSYEYISPFTSAGINDDFNINLESNKPGTMSLKIKSDTTVVGEYNITADTDTIASPVLCGDGLLRYLFFTANEGTGLYKLMFTKSSDGGISWQDPKLIKRSPNQNWGVKNAIYQENNLYLWTGGKFSSYLYMSIDGGDSFTETEIDSTNIEIQGTTSDLRCWTSSPHDNKFHINQSKDLGFTWNEFSNVTLEGAEDFEIEASAYDPSSGNYSFLVINKTGKDLRFLTTSNTGENSIISDNILSNGISTSTSFEGSVDLNVHKTQDNSYEWIITSSVFHSQEAFMEESLDMSGYSLLSYSVSSDGVTFSEWANYTEINGEKMDVIYSSKNWDIFFPEKGTACFLNGIVDMSGGMPILYKFNIKTASAYLFDDSYDLDLNYKGELSFKGVSSSGDVIPDGVYTWEFKHIDRAGYLTKETGTLTIDNNAPVLNLYENLTTPENPYPNQNVSVKIPINEINPDSGILYYRNSTGDWKQKEMTIDTSNTPNLYFEAVIPAFSSNVKTIYWKAVINDTCGNILTVDNDGRLFSYGRGVFEYVKEAGEIDPTLYDDWTWTYVFTSGTDHIDKVWLRRMVNGEIIEDIEISPSGEQNNTYSITISHDLNYQNATYKFMFSTDTGSEQIIEEIILKKPNIRIEEETEPPNSIDLNEANSLNVSFIISEYSEYLDYLYIEYQFDDLASFVRKNLTTSTSDNLSIAASIYRHSFTNFSRNCTQLTYRVVGVDLYGNEITLDKNRTINIIPELPSWQMTTEQQLITPIVALIVGVVSGVSYTFIASQKSTEERYHNLIEKDLRQQNIEKDTKIDLEPIEKTSERRFSAYLRLASKKYISLGITTVFFTGCYLTGWILVIFVNIAEFAMLGFTGAFLAAVFLWVLISDHSVERILRSKEREMTLKDQLILIGISLTIFISLLTIFLIGNTIAWWRVRVNQQSYNISGIIVPRALTTVLTTFFSSIFLLTWSTSKEVSNKAEELIKAEQENENPLNIMEKREKAISSIIGNVGKKGIIFIAIIGVTIIFASDLSIYATQGILFIIPFVIGAFITLIVANFLQKKQITETKRVVLDNLTICPYCKEKTSLGGTYCEYCGEKLVHGKRYNDGITCRNCNKVNAVGMKHCKYCGKKLTNMNKPEKENKPNKMKNNSDKLTEIKRLKAEKKSKKEK